MQTIERAFDLEDAMTTGFDAGRAYVRSTVVDGEIALALATRPHGRGRVWPIVPTARAWAYDSTGPIDLDGHAVLGASDANIVRAYLSSLMGPA